MIKNKYFVSTVLIFLLCSCKTTDNRVLDSKGTMFLWELNSGESTIYIAGSVHVAYKDLYPLNQEYYNAIDASDSFVMEADLKKASQKDVTDYTMERAMFSEGESLSDYVDDEFIDGLVTNVLSSFGIPYSSIQGFKPWFLGNLLAILSYQQHGIEAENGVDTHLQSYALTKGLDQIYLEEAKAQIEMLSSYSMDLQVKQLTEIVNEFDTLVDTLNDLFIAWEAGDINGFSDLFLPEFQTPEYADIYKTLLVDRNLDWAEQIDGFIQSGEDYFIVVGAGHLVGEESLISVLRKKGYKAVRK